ncbi:MAG: FAD:protein FMN transferase [Bacteroidota bacterium]
MQVSKNTLFHFEHQAMATQFTVALVGEDAQDVAWAAQQCFRRLDELELKLSRFIPDSDVSRINKLKDGEQLLIDYETWEVMKLAIAAQQWTQGAFDIGVAEHMNIFRAAKEGILNEFEMGNALIKAQESKHNASLYLDPAQPKFYCLREGMQFDLGGIGKGYALDQLALFLETQGIKDYSLGAGESTVLSVGQDSDGNPWQHTLAADSMKETIATNRLAISASGTFYQGNHIFDPRTGKNKLVSSFDRLWVACDSAALADALSTGLYLLSLAEIESLMESLDDIQWVAYSKDGKLFRTSQNNVNL